VVAAGQSRRLVPFNYPAVVAPLLWLLSAPLPPGTYGRLTLALQRLITDGVVGTLHLLGIPARQSGNLIQLATTVVGVEEACSGVRSLLSCLVAAVFFSATLVRRPAARIALILMAAPLALGMNFLRSLGLTLAADQGWSISGWVHDASGFAVLGLTAAALAALALALERERTAPRPAPREALPSPRPGPAYALVGATAAAAVIAGAFAWATQPGLPRPGTVPDLYALLPASPPGWVVETPEDLYRFRDTLQTDALAQRTYVRPLGDDVLQITVYLAYWRPGQAAVSLVAAHTPDACWPGAGWSAAPDDPRAAAPRGGGGLPRAEYRLFTQGDLAQHVWFWHLHGGEVINDAAPLSPFRLIPRVLEHGIRSDAAQIFLRISSNHPWNKIAEEKLMLEIMNGLAPIFPVSPAPP
jgi:exosortase/archaeosortase family protein